MTVAEYFRRKAEPLRHAITYDTVFDSRGEVVREEQHHALTCKKCELLLEAARAEKEAK